VRDSLAFVEKKQEELKEKVHGDHEQRISQLEKMLNEDLASMT